MRRNPRVTTTVAALALASAFAAASAQTDLVALPEPQHFGNVTVINGGVDLDQADRLRRMAPQYPLRVVFSVRDGNYAVADALVIRRDGQPVAEVANAGPWVLVDLPPGRYTLAADFEGQSSERAFSVNRQGSGSTVHWVAPPGVD